MAPVHRIAQPSIIAQATAHLLQRVEQEEQLNGSRESYITAVLKAQQQLSAGIKIEISPDDPTIYVVPSRSRGSLLHYVTRYPDTGKLRCDCDAGLEGVLCWHKPAIVLLRTIQHHAADLAADLARADDDLAAAAAHQTLPPTADLPTPTYHCLCCAAPLHLEAPATGDPCLVCTNPACGWHIPAEAMAAFV